MSIPSKKKTPVYGIFSPGIWIYFSAIAAFAFAAIEAASRPK